MEKNISLVGRLIRILLGMLLLFVAYKLMKNKDGAVLRKLAVALGIGGFVAIAQGYFGVCLARTLGLKTPV